MAFMANVPLEVIGSINDHLDLKSSIHLGTVSKLFREPISEKLRDKEEETLNKMLQLVSQQIKFVHSQMTSENSKAEVLANLLRRLIWTTTTVDEEPPDTLAGIQSHCMQEYDNLHLYVCEEMDLSWEMYNTLMENAQFEYRGFQIVGLHPHIRNDLDNFKELVETRYYDDDFKIHVYISFANDTYIEMIFDGQQLSCDVHTRIEERWHFITDMLENTEKHLFMKDNMIVFDANNEDEAIRELCQVIMTKIRPRISSNLFKGAESVNVSIWNSVYEENVVFASTIDKWMSKFNTENIIFDATQTAYTDYHTHEIP